MQQDAGNGAGRVQAATGRHQFRRRRAGDLIMQAMEQTDYNITISKLLGLTFSTLQYRLEKFSIKKPEGKEEVAG